MICFHNFISTSAYIQCDFLVKKYIHISRNRMTYKVCDGPMCGKPFLWRQDTHRWKNRLSIYERHFISLSLSLSHTHTHTHRERERERGKYVENFMFYYNLTRITGTSHEDQYTFMIISRSVLLRKRKFSGKLCRGNKKHILCSIACIFKNRAIFEVMRKIIVDPDTRQVTTGSMLISHWLSEATQTLS